MAYQLGDGSASAQATSMLNLMNKLESFLSGNGWTVTVAENGDSTTGDGRWIVCKGVGDFTGTDPYIHILLYNRYNYSSFVIRTASGYSSGSSFSNQPNISPSNWTSSNDSYQGSVLVMFDQPMTYFFQCSANHFFIACDIGVTVTTAYAGFYDRDQKGIVEPDELAFPVCVIASSSTTQETSGAVNAGISYGRVSGNYYNGYIFNGSEWKPYKSSTSDDDYCCDFFENNNLYIRTDLDGITKLWQVFMGDSVNPWQCWLKNVYATAGNNFPSFTQITDGTDNYITFQNANSTEEQRIFAVKMV